ncbi:MAG: sigma-70 family RNA polymerase sigma factor [Planctomycetes bacterium]|nr:sigma-70 family RNA polymerase sigma factor [Planctomycetota bacterium]MBI3847342.1 sigma-70 family RNA polymerase sigma factor [Planctomycetota bacterium]
MTNPTRGDVTRLLDSAERGDETAATLLLPIVYDELRRLARSRLAREPAGQTLQATALVHEAYVRLVGEEGARFDGRAHFFAAAARAMRRILVERARHHGRRKRGGGRDRLSLSDVALSSGDDASSVDVLDLNEALERLARYDERKCDVVSLRFFAGLDIDEIARALGVSRATIKADWSYARAWLHRELTKGDTRFDAGANDEC